jgi:ABC-2 type transporter
MCGLLSSEGIGLVLSSLF